MYLVPPLHHSIKALAASRPTENGVNNVLNLTADGSKRPALVLTPALWALSVNLKCVNPNLLRTTLALEAAEVRQLFNL